MLWKPQGFPWYNAQNQRCSEVSHKKYSLNWAQKKDSASLFKNAKILCFFFNLCKQHFFKTSCWDFPPFFIVQSLFSASFGFLLVWLCEIAKVMKLFFFNSQYVRIYTTDFNFRYQFSAFLFSLSALISLAAMLSFILRFVSLAHLDKGHGLLSRF